jgi:hypothetical protein
LARLLGRPPPPGWVSLASSERSNARKRRCGFSWCKHFPMIPNPFLLVSHMVPTNAFCYLFLGSDAVCVRLLRWRIPITESFLGSRSWFFFAFRWVNDVIKISGAWTIQVRQRLCWRSMGRTPVSSAPPLASTSRPSSIKSMFSFLLHV